MVSFVGQWVGSSGLHAALRRVDVQAGAASKEIVLVTGAKAVKGAQGNFQGSHAKGQPHVGGDKPNVVTGNLRRSITLRPWTQPMPGTFEVRVEVNMVYGRRVEKGFSGTDSLGRNYDQRPMPYFTPAVEKATAEMEALAYATFTKYFARL